MKKLRFLYLSAIGLAFYYCSPAQQLPDTAFTFTITHKAYQAGKGPVIYIDQAHHNFHTKDGGFFAFAKLLKQDGYIPEGLDKPVTDLKTLEACRILVIANALHSSNIDNWALPTPSAFSDQEIEIIRYWIKSGGRLLLIADHMPFAGAATTLGKAFGFEFLNGFAFTGVQTWPPTVFNRKNNSLENSPVANGIQDYEKIDSLATFTGSAFKAPTGSLPVLSFLSGHYSLQPDTAWRFNAATPSHDLDGFCQGAILEYGKGRVAVFGEAAMFTAQIVNGNFRVGFNSESAPQNAQFTLNLIHWLDEMKEDNH